MQSPQLVLAALLCAVGAAAAHNPALLSAGPQHTAPPLQDVLQYLETGGGTVAVADLGGAGPWLRELHRRAAAPVLLWRGPARPETGSAPEWLEGQRAYLLVARRPDRLLGFIGMDTERVTPAGRILKDATGETLQDLKLNSAAHTVLAIDSLLDPLEEKDAARLLTTLWSRHDQFRGLLLSQAGPRGWDRRYLDPFAYPRRVRRRPRVRGYAVLRPPSGAGGAELATLLSRRARDLGLAPLRVCWWIQGVETSAYALTVNGYSFRMIGSNLRMTHELSVLLNSSLTPVDGEDQWHHGEQVIGDACIRSTRNTIFGNADITTMVCNPRGSDTDELGLLTGYADFKYAGFAVPQAPLLPFWSLPVRVFGPGIWLLCAASVIGYALSWRLLTGLRLSASLAVALRALTSCGGAPQDRVAAVRQRVQLGAALLGSAVVIVSIYQGRLYTLMMEPEREEEMDTLEQLATANLTLLTLGFSRVFGLYMDAGSGTKAELALLRRITAHTVHIPGYWTEMIKRLRAGNYSDAVHLANVHGGLLEAYQADFKKMHLMRRLPTMPAIEMLHVPRNSPWRERMNYIHLWVRDAGLWHHWRSTERRMLRILWRVKSKEMDTEPQLEPDDILRKFSMNELQSGFQLLGFGLVLATVVMVVELVIGRRRNLLQSMPLKTPPVGTALPRQSNRCKSTCPVQAQ